MRVFSEALVIVASVLLAFSIQAWWEDSKEQEEAHKLLSAILDETVNNLAAINENLKFRDTMIASCNELLSLSDKEQDGTESIDNLIGSLTWVKAPDFTWSALDTIVEGDQLVLVENVALRRQLIALQREQRLFQTFEEDELEAVNELTRFLVVNALLPQIAKSDGALSLPGGDGSILYPYTYQLGLTENHEHLANNNEFLGVVLRMLWIQYDWKRRMEAYSARIASIEPMLRREVEAL